MRPEAEPAFPLRGVRVIDFTNTVAGPTSTFILADMGAEVIKVEGPRARPHNVGSAAPRLRGAPDRPYNRVPLYNELNRGKLGLILDASAPAGRAALLQLVAMSDVVVENFAPRVLPNLQLEYDDLRAIRPEIILVSMPAFGNSGPYRDRISYGPGIDAMSGLSFLTGYEGGPPLKPGNFYCDQNAGLTAALAVLAALHYRRGSGRGQRLEVAMIEGELQLIGESLLAAASNGRERPRLGNHDPSMAPHGVFPCREPDSWVAIAVGSDLEWQRLCEVIGQPNLVADPRFADVVSRHRHQAAAEAALAEWTRQHTTSEAQSLLQAAGISAGAALRPSELFRDPQAQARGLFQYAEHPEIGRFPHTRVAWRLAATPSGVKAATPLYGQHNERVLGELVGYSAGQIGSLREGGLIADEPPI